MGWGEGLPCWSLPRPSKEDASIHHVVASCLYFLLESFVAQHSFVFLIVATGDNA
jgi:hypothetical protein